MDWVYQKILEHKRREWRQLKESFKSWIVGAERKLEKVETKGFFFPLFLSWFPNFFFLRFKLCEVLRSLDDLPICRFNLPKNVQSFVGGGDLLYHINTEGLVGHR